MKIQLFANPNFKPEVGNGYIELPKDGASLSFVIVDSVHTGCSYWQENNGQKRKLRFRTTKRSEVPVINPTKDFNGELDSPKVFFLMRVYNMQTGEIGILEVVQKTIKDALWSYLTDERIKPLAEESQVEFTVKTEKSGKNTKYTLSCFQLTPAQIATVQAAIANDSEFNNFDVDALYTGDAVEANNSEVSTPTTGSAAADLLSKL